MIHWMDQLRYQRYMTYSDRWEGSEAPACVTVISPLCRSGAKKSHEHRLLGLSRESPKAQVRANKDMSGQSELEIESPTTQ